MRPATKNKTEIATHKRKRFAELLPAGWCNTLRAWRDKVRERIVCGRAQPIVAEPDRQHVCKNCRNRFVGNFCPVCGQSASERRLSRRTVWENVGSGATNITRGFFFTITELFYRPGYMINDFIKGRRIRYVKPIQMLFILSAVVAVEERLLLPAETSAAKTELTAQAERNREAIQSEISEELKTNGVEADSVIIKIGNKAWELGNRPSSEPNEDNFFVKLYRMMRDWASNNRAFETIIMLPFMALGTKWAFRRSRANPHLNYVETLYALCYRSCQVLVATAILLPFLTGNEDADGLFLAVNIVSSLWILGTLFRNRPWSTFWRVVLSYVYAYGVLAAVAVCILAATLGIISAV